MWWSIIQPMFSFLSGALIGLFSSVAHDIYLDIRSRKRLAVAIKQEILSLFELIKEDKWDRFIKSKTVAPFELSINHNYFVVFEENANQLLLLDPDLIEKIIIFYNRSKAFFDEISRYNSYFRLPDYNKNELKRLHKELKLAFEKLRISADEVCEMVDKFTH